jgi:hypothetical protein
MIDESPMNGSTRHNSASSTAETTKGASFLASSTSYSTKDSTTGIEGQNSWNVSGIWVKLNKEKISHLKTMLISTRCETFSNVKTSAVNTVCIGINSSN